jgi:SAM-dependent methyltransferase
VTDAARKPRGQYSAPRYYEIAFDMNRKQEVDFLAHAFRTYARRPIRTVLDIACGTGPHLIRLAERGYRMSGLDLSPENIDFLRERAAGKGFEVGLHVADMTQFRLPRPVDAAICMQDSQGHLLTNEAILAHLAARRGQSRRAGSTSSTATCAPPGRIPRGSGPGPAGAAAPRCGPPSRPSRTSTR